ncbi:ribonuclease HI family protein [Burkholderia sp. Leaf177]|uniref:ribonuclease HI family protein n=1 Tax=Burkholderia sp. Leaf177 TaxID=1736287 RepID=UPI0009E88C7D|nr:ribonuclease HI family protein [Burkholderia sp. Leaf177]
MFEFDELFQIAYKRERAISRRLTKLTALSEHAALTQTLEKSAGAASLAELVEARRLEQATALRAAQRRREDRAAVRAARNLKTISRDTVTWHAWFDGSAHPNPGKIGIGGLLESPDGEIMKISAIAGHGDSCKAEYLALVAVLEAALSQRPAPRILVIHGDSQIVIEDVLRDTASSAPALIAYATRARELIAQLADVRFQWIPRHRNTAADALSQSAIREDHANSRTSVTGVSPNASLNA